MMLANKLMGGAAPKLYVDDVFSTYLRAGTGADVTVNTGIDMTKGYMLWSKCRSAATDNAVYDSARGVTYDLVTNSTAAQTTQSTGLKAVSSTGHTIGSLAKMNTPGATYVDFVFRRAPKFFDCGTYTGNGVAGRQIPHNLGVAPGMVIVKRTDSASAWSVVHNDGTTARLFVDPAGLNSTAASNGSGASASFVSEAYFSVGSTYLLPNVSGASYVWYAFAHDPSEDGIIQCGSYLGGSANLQVPTGWEPQFVLIKSTSTENWVMFDSMRGVPTGGGGDRYLFPNLSNAEGANASQDFINFNSSGFELPINSNGSTNAAGTSFIYLAIRRPNKPPTSGTEVFAASAIPSGSNINWPASIQTDMVIPCERGGAAYNFYLSDRLRGGNRLQTLSTEAEVSAPVAFDVQTGVRTTGSWYTNGNFAWFFRRAPGFFDVVCYTGNGSVNTELPHNLMARPELVIVKRRDSTNNWAVSFRAGVDSWGSSLSTAGNFAFNSSNGSVYYGPYDIRFTNTYFCPGYVGGGVEDTNTSGGTYVAYLFSSLPGISKVGSYTGNGSSRTINCGFSTGARFILIKRTDSTGDWYVWDSARGVVAANDPHLSLNTNAAEVTTDDSVDPDSTGFIVNQNTATNINVSGGSYVFLAIS